MALRHGIPDFEPAFDRSWDELTPVARLKAPVKVGFRSGADLTHVISAVKSSKFVEVEAAAGAGKTTVLPVQLAVQMNELVVHVFPNQYLACDVYDYVSTSFEGATFIELPTQVFPDKGVVYISAACLVAKWIEAAEVVLPRCVLFHDESHESDGFTYLVKKLGPTCRDVISYVPATASPSAGGFRQPETEGTLKKVETNNDKLTTWDVEDGTDPWCVSYIDRNLLIFEDDKAKAADLLEKYQQYGMRAFRLHSRMSLQAFRVAMKIARDPNESIAVLIADYSFRSGFTMPVDIIVDTCMVRTMTVDEGRPLRQWRAVFELEKYQAANRGGRMRGQTTTYYYPREVIAGSSICDLEYVEMEAAALIMRLLGFNPVAELKDCRMATDGIPRMLHSALSGQMPLAILKPDQLTSLESFYTPKGRRSPYLRDDVIINKEPYDVVNSAVSADTARKRGMAGVSLPPESIVKPTPLRPVKARADPELDAVALKRDSGYDEGFSMQDCVDALESMVDHADEIEQLQVGKYYYAAGNNVTDITSVMFPEGYVSVLRALAGDKSKSLHFGYSAYQRGVAISSLVVQYNVLTCEMRVLSRVLPEAKKIAVGKDLAALRQWATETAQRLSTVLSDLQLISSLLTRIVGGYCSLVEMRAMEKEERQGFRHAIKLVEQLPSATIGPPQEMLRQFRDNWKEGEVIGSVASSSVVSDGSVDEPVGPALDYVKMPTTGRGMRATVKYKPNKFLMWAAGGYPSTTMSKTTRGKSFDAG